MSNKELNLELKLIGKKIAEKMVGLPHACSTCDKSYCCEYQVQIGIGEVEFEQIKHLVTPTHIARAKQQIENKTPILMEGVRTYRCPFLSDEGKCEIYDERFIVCAGYCVTGDNIACNKDSGIAIVSIVDPDPILTIASENDKQLDRFNRIATGKPSDVLEEFRKRYRL